jgi:serine phosphatase RsbU (regulator of sigma subunit)/ligand-binding sensor domain-containing protein
MKTIYLIFLIFLITGLLFGQDEGLEFENITTISGLSASRAKCIFQDSEGYLWIGTLAGGLNRYDGYSFTVFKNRQDDSTSLGHNDVYNIAEDKNGNIWVATDEGISKYVKNRNIFINYYLRSYFSELSDLSYHNAYEIFIDSKNRVWIGTSYHGILLFNEEKQTFKAIPLQFADSTASLPQVCGDITEDKNGTIYAAAGVSGLMCYNEEESVFQPAPMDFKDWNLIKSQDVFRCFADSENNIWVMTASDLYKYIPTSKKLVYLVNYESSNAINQGHEGELIEDSEKTMWLVHSNLQHPLKFPNLSDDYIITESPEMQPTDIFIDSFGIVWICDWDRGIYKYNPAKQIFHQPKSKINGNIIWQDHTIHTICQSVNDPNQIYVYSSLNMKNFMRSYNLQNGRIKDFNLNPENIDCMSSNEDGTFWLGLWFNGGLLKWNPKTDKLVPYFADATKSPNLANISVTSLKKDKQNNLWIATTNGLYRLSPDEKTFELILADYAIPSIYLDEDIVWISTYGAGFIKYNSITKHVENYQHDKYKNSISNNIVWDLYRDKEGFLWLGTENGLNQFDLRNNSFKVYNTSNGLDNDIIAGIIPGSNNSLWITTDGYVVHMYKDSLGRMCFSSYNDKNGLINPDFLDTVTRFKDNQGNVYFGSRRGLYYFKPQKRKSPPPLLYINEIAINGKPLLNPSGRSGRDNIRSGASIELSHTQNTLAIDFIALHFAQPDNIRYAYYLEGYDPGWLYSHDREVQYLNLNPGSYTFHLRAANSDGVWVAKDINLRVTIAKPWWNTWYAYFLYFALLVTILTGVRQFELKRRREREEKKLLEAENKRKTQELEEARALQLSMLPKTLPQLPNLDIAVYMKTATEVGGDYYDFHVGLDGTLTVVIGDATGHGMKAGTMVTTAKSLFNSYAPNPDILFSFQEITRCIRQMNLGKMSMCMTMLKIRGNKMQISSAGMPPSYIFRRETRIVEEHLLQGMPLGTMDKFQYKIQDTTLKPGDTILLLTDGLPELQSENGDVYGYKRVRNLFEEAADNNPEDIINEFKNDSSAWVNDKEPEDDVTFVVIKVK